MLPVLLLSQLGLAETLRVDQNDSSAYAHIQDAIDAASTGDQIEITAGSYSECLDTRGTDLSLVGDSGTTINGTGLSCPALIEIDAGETILLEGLTLMNPDGRGITVSGSALELHGVSITGCEVDKEPGGAILLTDAQATLTDSTLAGNAAPSGGAISASSGSTLTIENSSFSDNQAKTSSGGALHISQGSTVEIDSSSFSNDTASGSGGAIYAMDVDSSVQLTDTNIESCQGISSSGGAIHLINEATLNISGGNFSNNTATSGGAIDADEASLSITGASFAGNSANQTTGGAIQVTNESTLEISSSIFSSNTTNTSGGAIYADSSNVLISNSTFQGNSTDQEAGGALYLEISGADTSELTVESTGFENNTAATLGGAIAGRDLADVIISNSGFSHNTSIENGGAIMLYSSESLLIDGSTFCMNEAAVGGAAWIDIDQQDDSTLTNNVFIENKADTQGGALFFDFGATLLLDNTLVGNQAPAGGALYLATTQLTLTNTIIAHTTQGDGIDGTKTFTSLAASYSAWFDNTSSHTSAIFKFTPDSDGNIETDPRFLAYSLDGDCSNDDLQLAADSALIDAGDPALLDEDGSPSDIGALNASSGAKDDDDDDDTGNIDPAGSRDTADADFYSDLEPASGGTIGCGCGHTPPIGGLLGLASLVGLAIGRRSR